MHLLEATAALAIRYLEGLNDLTGAEAHPSLLESLGLLGLDADQRILWATTEADVDRSLDAMVRLALG